MLSEVGVQASVNVVEGGVWTQIQRAMKPGPMHMVGWYSLGDADFAAVWFTKASGRAIWTNPEYEKPLPRRPLHHRPPPRARQAYHRMMQIMHEENPAMFLFGLPSPLRRSAGRLTGFGAASDKIMRLTKADLA